MIIKDIKRTYYHPLNRKRKLLSLIRYFKFGFYMRMNKNKMFVHKYIHNTKLLVGRKSTSSMLQYLNGLNDFEEMGLLLHFLTENDLFVDVGANVGVYSILASGVSKAKSIAIEPSYETGNILKQNIAINNLGDKITPVNYIIGNQSGKVSFTKGLDSINRVVRETDDIKNTELHDEETLDNILNNMTPNLIKIDVEGYEVNVLKGALNTLKKADLKILLIETNGLSSKYKLNEDDIFSILQEYGFTPYSYSPFERRLIQNDKNTKHDNTIFIRDIEFVETRIKNSPKIYINKLYF